MDEYQFGYPRSCTLCKAIANCELNLLVASYLKQNSSLRLMLIGQDPTIYRQPERVKHVLILDETVGQLSRWLRELFGMENFETLTRYTTNLVKCSFEKPPSSSQEGGLKFLMPYFENCMKYLKEEIKNFKPARVLTLVEPAH